MTAERDKWSPPTEPFMGNGTYEISSQINVQRKLNHPDHNFIQFLWSLEVGVLCSIFVVGLIGNWCVVFVVWRRRVKRSRMHLFILHIAIADLVVIFFQVLPEIIIRLQYGFWGSEFLCKLVKYVQVVGMYGSTFVLVCTALDRFLAIKYPMQTFKSTKRRVYSAIACAWGFALVLSIPQLVFFELHKYQAMCTFKQMSEQVVQSYVMWYFVSVLVIPTIFLAYFYSMIAKQLMNKIRNKTLAIRSTHCDPRQKEFTPRASSTVVISKAKLKTIKMTFVIVITFVICWLPFFIAQILGVWKVFDRNNTISSVCHLIGNLNSCVNPWIYMGFSGHLLKDLKENLRFWKKQPRHSTMSRFARSTTSGRGSERQYRQTTLTTVMSPRVLPCTK